MERKPLPFLLTLAITASSSTMADTSLQQRYQNAVNDAEVATAEEISRQLAPISPLNDNLVWKDDNKAVLLLTWTGWNGYDSQVGNDMSLAREVWATPVPYLQQFCQNASMEGGDLTLRLEQLLGLPPQNGKTRFVEIWANPADLFRPAPDPAITDHEAELDFPVATGLTVAQSHRDWVNNLKANSYGDKGYPWTRLGYTYDWGNPDSEVGLSEYVIRQGANVQIKAVSSQQEYCAR